MSGLPLDPATPDSATPDRAAPGGAGEGTAGVSALPWDELTVGWEMLRTVYRRMPDHRRHPEPESTPLSAA